MATLDKSQLKFVAFRVALHKRFNEWRYSVEEKRYRHLEEEFILTESDLPKSASFSGWMRTQREARNFANNPIV